MSPILDVNNESNWFNQALCINFMNGIIDEIILSIIDKVIK